MRSPLPALLCALAAAAEPPKMPKLNDPELKLEAFASSPDIEVPTTVCAAPDGSVYVGCDPRDARLNTDKPEDYIVRYSSMGPDRKRTVFADKIYSPAGSQWHDGWLYVLHDPFLTRFKDTNGDGVADVREDLVSNLGITPNPGLNDHVVSGFVLGMDGYFYISVGDRGIYKAHGKDGSEITLQGGGIVRCRPDGTDLNIFSTGTRNHLAVLLDEEDNAFTRDNTDDGNGWWTRVTHHIEGGYYGYPYDYHHAKNYGVTEPSQQTLDAIKQHSPGEDLPDNERFLPAMADFGSGSPTGGLCYLSDGLPERYRGKLLFTEWGKGALFLTEVARDGATFKVVSDTRIVEAEKGSDFRPMQISVAPDGSLLIADWGFGGWKAPKTVGTVWRLSWPEAKPAPRLKDESKASIDELIGALGHPDRDQRLRAQFALVKRNTALEHTSSSRTNEAFPGFSPSPVGTAVAGALSNALNGPTTARVQQAHVLWALKHIIDSGKNSGGAEGVLMFSLPPLAESPELTLRRQVPRILEDKYFRKQVSSNFVWLASILDPLQQDADASVRLAAVTATGRLGGLSLSSISTTREACKDPDRFVRWAARKACSHTVGGVRELTQWLKYPEYSKTWPTNWEALEQADPTNVEAFTFFAERCQHKMPSERQRAIESLGRIAYQPTPFDGHWWGTQPVKSPRPLNTVQWAGTPKALATLSTALGDADASVRLEAAKAFTNFAVDPQGAGALATLRARLPIEKDPAVQRQLIESLGVQRDPKAMDVFMQIALDEKADAEFRATAIGAVVNIGGEGAKKTIAQIANAQLSPAATLKVIQAAGELKVIDAAPALIAHLKDEDRTHREAAAKSLGQLGAKSNATPALLAALSDKDGKVQQAVVEALGAIRDKSTLPALIEFAKTKRARKELLSALSAMPDPQSLPVLVSALDEKSSGVRRTVLAALVKMLDQAKPLVDDAIASGKVPPEFVPEIRGFFERGPITKWKVVGPFENVWSAVHPPEKDALAANGTPDLHKQYENAEGKHVGWIDVTGSSDDGRIDLGKFFKNNGMVCAYAYTEIEATEAADAKLFAGSDDQLAIWLNGQKVHDSGPSARGFDPDKDEVVLHLSQGTNRIFAKIGNLSGTWEFAARIPGLNGNIFKPSKEPAPEEKQRAFVLATKPDGSWVNSGSPRRGEKVFGDPMGPIAGICATCHKVKGLGGDIGPDLSLVGSVYKRADLITSIQEPSKTIALGFEQVMVETKSGDTYIGALRQETGDSLTIKGADGQPHIVQKGDVKSRQAIPTSLMPPGLTLPLKPEQFADLLAYLETLRGE